MIDKEDYVIILDSYCCLLGVILLEFQVENQVNIVISFFIEIVDSRGEVFENIFVENDLFIVIELNVGNVQIMSGDVIFF